MASSENCSGVAWQSGPSRARLSAVRAFYRYLQREHGIESPLLRAAKAPKLGRKLPTYLDRLTDRDAVRGDGGASQ